MKIAEDIWRRLSQGLNLSVPATTSQVQAAEAALGAALPDEYKEFLYKTNGAEGTIGEDAYVIFWQAEDLDELNRAYEVGIYAPGLLIIGSNGGGEAFVIDTASGAFYMVPFIGMDRSLLEHLGDDFWSFLDALFKS